MGKTLRASGTMSGTSMDGVDVALLETDGEDVVTRGPSQTLPYESAFKAQLARTIEEAKALSERRAWTGSLADTERELTNLHVAAIESFLQHNQLARTAIDVIGFHGHTILHAPGQRLTVQIGDGPQLARRLGIGVVYDLRVADCTAGGQGAPLAPVYHRALAARLPERPVVVLNIGGVANVTWIGRDGGLIAFDTGPGNALIDDWMTRNTGKGLDAGGEIAAGGRHDEGALTALLTHDYFGKTPPKSLDRNAFSPNPVERLSLEDGAATLTAFTASSVARAREHFPEQPRLWVITGGGRRNKTLMAMIAERVEAAVAPAEAAGMDGDAMEAEAWAYLAVRSLKGLPISYPGTTGAPGPLTGGVHIAASG